MINRLAITSGEPAGIGPELIARIAQSAHADQLIAIADPHLIEARAKMLGLALTIELFDPDMPAKATKAGHIYIAPVALRAPCQVGSLNAANAAYVLDSLDMAIQGCQQGRFDAMITPPLHKEIINEAGISFTGHTEYLQLKCHCDDVVMMLAHSKMRVALVTTHLPLSEVSNAISAEKLRSVTEILHRDLTTKFGLASPRILVAGLNPHAGEGGYLGREEIDIIEPALKALRGEGMNLIGPLPADTLFTDKYLNHCDAVLAMYHDQGLPVLKYSGFGSAVNITLGLPIIRTSVDHGTALDIAGKGSASADSLVAAVEFAATLARQQQRNSKGNE